MPSVAPPRAGAIDALAISAAELRALPAPMQRAVREAKAYADRHFASMSPPPRVLVSASPANGGAPITTIVPPGAKEPLRVHTHYHGDRATSLAGENEASAEIARRIKAGDRTVYVIPEARTPGSPTDWGNVKDLDRTRQDALDAAGLGGAKLGYTVVSAHSSGGRALVNGIKDGGAVRASELIIQDALYEGVNGPGTHSALRRHLPRASADIGKVTIVPSDHTPTSGPRGRQLAADLRAAGRAVEIAAPARTHAAAGAAFGGFTPPTDGFERLSRPR